MYFLLLPLHPYHSQAAMYEMQVQKKILFSSFTRKCSSTEAAQSFVVANENKKRHPRNHQLAANAEARNLFSALAIAGKTEPKSWKQTHSDVVLTSEYEYLSHP